ncbi:Alkaline phosphatase synthesis sensor protein PhoR [Fundidesulfovibrio magnetotacticus]|uniref:histidine kinase n=1 Tax=Fundidesulfovibrio magnetotacticus TaxID=2730080 RepID=A0A6V8LX97_9BACT|nr:sensor histidine kinase [Fundidesulfovibrio magnetotacticus]GFK92905.1 Alkaline phosphatase synthesis sensor protein PhoR [Fundidesulfovibrio magnetotacticus]
MQAIRRTGARTALAACLILLFAAAQAHAGPVPSIASFAVLEDPTGAPTLREVVSGAGPVGFREAQRPYHHAANGRPCWLKITLAFPPETRGDAWTLDLNWNYLSGLECHFPSSPAHDVARGGYRLHVNSAIPLPPPDGESLTAYVRLTEYHGMTLDPVVVSREAADRGAEARRWLLGMLFGLLLAMFVYNLFLFASLRDACYGWYVAHVLFVTGYYSIVNGFDFLLFPQDGPEALRSNHTLFCLIFALMIFSIGMFTRTFLLLDKGRNALNLLVSGQLGLCVAFVGVLFAVGEKQASALAPVLALATSAVVVVAGAVRAAQGFKPAGIFLMGWSVYVACGVLHSLVWSGTVQPTPATLYAPEFGSAVEVLVMSLALAYRVKILEQTKEQAERESRRLAGENALLASILENSRLGIGLVRGGELARANNALRVMAGQEEGDGGIALEGLPGLAELLGGPERGGLLEREGVVGVGGDWRNLRALGKVVDPASPESGAVWVVEDVTERKKLEQLKENIERIVHHDLRSPLSSIYTLQQAVGYYGPLNDKQRQYCRMIGETAARGLDQLNAALAMYKVESGAYPVDIRAVNLAESLDRAIRELEGVASGQEAAVELLFGQGARPEALYVLGDGFLLHVVLVNLLRNALEARGREEKVTVAVSAGAQARLDISNPGEVPGDIRERFFGKFVTSGKKGGTGLGAYSARIMARAMGGDVELDCSRPGRTTVTVLLDRAEQPEAYARAS